EEEDDDGDFLYDVVLATEDEDGDYDLDYLVTNMILHGAIAAIQNLRDQVREQADAEELLENLQRFTAAELEELPTLSQGQAENLKYEDGPIRVWIQRGQKGVDYSPELEVSIEVFRGGRWEVAETYEG
ncbi:unnamed protein product, partial [marine sediment metagenome]